MTSIVFPDVCKTPAPGGPIPVPYPNIGSSPPSAASSPKKVKLADQEFAQHMDNLRAAGDADAGAANGVASARKLQQQATGFLMHAFNLKVEGAMPAVLIGRGLMNHSPLGAPATGPEAPSSRSTRHRQ